MFETFEPPALLRNAHTQTLLASLGRRGAVTRRNGHWLIESRERLLTSSDGVVLQAWLNDPPAARPDPDSRISPASRPLVVLIHGWLGGADSTYLLSAAGQLLAAGYRVARLNLRDHGDTAHLNVGMFHSARIREVVDAVIQLRDTEGDGRVGVMGFSLGGNFALRIAREVHRAHGQHIPTLAVCPAVDPAATMHAIDHGWGVYRWYFVRKWHRSLRAKAAAFPDRYDFTEAFRMRTVATLTDLFVRDHTEFGDTAEYLQRYSLIGDALQDTRATVIAAQDDPIIPSTGFAALPPGIRVIAARRGGHCGFVDNRSAPGWMDRAAVRYFERTLPRRA